MATRARLPDGLFFNGTLLTLPIDDDETVPQWLERLAFVLSQLRPPVTQASLDATNERARRHTQEVVNGVGYGRRGAHAS